MEKLRRMRHQEHHPEEAITEENLESQVRLLSVRVRALEGVLDTVIDELLRTQALWEAEKRAQTYNTAMMKKDFGS